MSRRRHGADGPARILCVDKPEGWTSFDVVRRVRNITGYRRVGHGGTLDPFATGVLVLGLGGATRLMRFLSEGDKLYDACLHFGAETDSEDCTGEILRRSDTVPTHDAIVAALPGFTGTILQVPPRLSAIHVDGERSYRRARRGEDFELQAREVRIDGIELVEYHPPEGLLRVRCGGGTYIRALARDLGRSLDSAAFLQSLRRTRVSGFGLDSAMGLDEFAARWEAGERGAAPSELVRDWARIELDEEACARVRHGIQPQENWWESAGWTDLPDRVALVDRRGELVAIAEPREGSLRLSWVSSEEGRE